MVGHPGICGVFGEDSEVSTQAINRHFRFVSDCWRLGDSLNFVDVLEWSRVADQLVNSECWLRLVFCVV